jgi:hypothetical protein
MKCKCGEQMTFLQTLSNICFLYYCLSCGKLLETKITLTELGAIEEEIRWYESKFNQKGIIT